MTTIGGSKPVYEPVTPSVDNNAKPSTGGSPEEAGHGVLKPGPNVTWVTGVVKKDEETMAKRAAFIAENDAMGDRDQYLANQPAAVFNQRFPQLQQGQQAQQEETTVGPSRIVDTVEDTQKTSQKVLDDEAKHDQEVAKAKNQQFQNLLDRDADKLRQKAEQLDVTQGTGAPAA